MEGAMLNLIRAVWVDFEISASVCEAHLLRLNNPNCFYPSPKCRSNLRVQKYNFFSILHQVRYENRVSLHHHSAGRKDDGISHNCEFHERGAQGCPYQNLYAP